MFFETDTLNLEQFQLQIVSKFSREKRYTIHGKDLRLALQSLSIETGEADEVKSFLLQYSEFGSLKVLRMSRPDIFLSASKTEMECCLSDPRYPYKELDRVNNPLRREKRAVEDYYRLRLLEGKSLNDIVASMDSCTN